MITISFFCGRTGSSVGRQEAAWAVSPSVSPPASDARREFSTDEKGCAAEQTGSDKGNASAGTVSIQ